MQAWLGRDDRGCEYLVRSGTGAVTAVVPVGIVGPGEQHTFYRVEIYCDAPHGRPGAIRFSAHPIIAADDPLFDVASEVLREVCPVSWSAQWHRHDWIPGDLPLGTLNLLTDARCVLAGLYRVALPELVDVAVPDFVPVRWPEPADEGQS